MELFEYLNGAVTPYHAVELGADILKKAGFTEQRLDETFCPERGKGYFIRVYGTGLIALAFIFGMQT